MRVLALLAVLAALLAGCSSGPAPQPEVTFAAAGQSATARPVQYCDLAMTDCTKDAAAPVTLRVPAGTPVQVTVPGEISGTPWQIAFTYRDGSGTQADARTPVFAPGSTTAYTLTLDAPTDRLLTAEVQQYGAPPQANADGGVDFPIRASWVLIGTA